jgi:hypothetical protein
MKRLIPILTKNPSMLALLLIPVLVLVLGGCGGGGTTGGGGASTNTTGGGGTSAGTTGGGTVPSGLRSATVELTPSRDSGVSGGATLTDTSNGVEVVVEMQNLQDQIGTEHPAHIHQGGTCADDRADNEAPVQYPLNPIYTGHSGTGTSTTTIQGVTVTQLFSGPPKYINVHSPQTGNESPPGISCADLSSSGGSTTGATGESTAAGKTTQ